MNVLSAPTPTTRHSWQWPAGEGELDCDCAVLAQHLLPSPLPYPCIYALELTPMCNHRCTVCSNVFAHKQQHTPTPFSAAGWQQVLERIAPHAQRLKLTGGEPTCHPQFTQIIATVDQQAVPFTLFTNGNWLHPEEVLEVLQQSSSCLGLLVSLHGADAKTHDAFTGLPGSFATVCRNIQHAVQAGLTVHTSTVLTRFNHTQIEPFLHLAQSLGATCSVFNRYIGRSIPALELPADMLTRTTTTIETLAATGFCTRFGTPMPVSSDSFTEKQCLAGTATCTIDPWGYVRPCNHAPQVAGHILNDPFEQLWHSPTMHAWRDLESSQPTAEHTPPNSCAICRADMLLRTTCSGSR